MLNKVVDRWDWQYSMLGTVFSFWWLEGVTKWLGVISLILTIILGVLKIEEAIEKRQARHEKKEKDTKTLMLWVTLFFFFLMTGCSGIHVAKPQQGGKADFSFGKQFSITQPENTTTPTEILYDRDMVPWTNYFSTNNYILRETYRTTFGAHQADDARSGYTAVQKAHAVIKAQSPLMYGGLVLIVAALAMSYFQAKFPAIFTPGLKLIGLTFISGLTLCILPSMTSNTTIVLVGWAGIIIILAVYLLAKQFGSNTNNSTPADSEQEAASNNKTKGK